MKDNTVNNIHIEFCILADQELITQNLIRKERFKSDSVVFSELTKKLRGYIHITRK